LELIRTVGNGRVDATIGSALDLFGGDLRYQDVLAWQAANTSADKDGNG
jgi:phosphoribosylformimino-5-aminoimidazole carboxamide ribotide isomerase